MKQIPMNEDAIWYGSTSRNRYGDLITAGATAIKCLFRDISSFSRINNREETTIKGIFWFPPDSGVAKGDVIGYKNEIYRVEDVTNAKSLLTKNTVQFIKCYASLYRAIS